MAAQAALIKEGPPMIEVKNIFFKALTPINYYTEEADADAVQNEVAFQYFNRGLEISNKYGCLFMSYDNSLFLLRIGDILANIKDSSNDPVSFENLKKVKISNTALPVAPNVIALSNGEDYLAVDTVRGDSSWVVIFKLSDFVNQGGSCPPFCEIRCSASPSSRVSAISWNPGESMNNLVAINVDDGALFMAKIIGQNNVELNKFAGGGVRSLCWSPKGKQLVIGRINGNLSQLKLDLSLAKDIPKPDPESVPVSIWWTQTTQFLIVFQKESAIDFMQLDLPKGAPPVYTNSGDIFVSEIAPEKSTCFFIPFVPWNTVLATTNSASDVVVLMKETQNNSELWVPGDVTDSRRAAFQLDNYARGVAVYFGSQDPVVFSEVESYPPMPLVFLLSQRGSLSVYSIVNSSPDAPSMKVETTASIPDAIFSIAKPSVQSVQPTPPRPTQQSVQSLQQQQQQQPAQVPKPSMPTFGQPAQGTSLFQSSPAAGGLGSFMSSPQQQQQSLFKSPQPVNVPTPTQSVQSNQTASPLSFVKPQGVPSPQQQQQQQQIHKPTPQAQTVGTKLGGFAQQLPTNPRLGTSTLPSPKDMAGLQKAVEEKRREMTTQLQKGVELKGLEEDEQCAFVISEVRKFEQRLGDFVARMDSSRISLSGVLNTSFSAIEKSVMSTLNCVEDFASNMELTTSAQKEEVEILKERILNHFSQLEYAKSLVERSRDPRYLEHLRSQPLDPASQQKFEEISKLHNYIKNQIAECRGFFYEQSRKRDSAMDRASYSQLIYLTLSNHSKIIRRLTTDLDNIKERLGLGKHAFDEAEYLAVCEASYTGGSKKNAGVLNDSKIDDITLNDLTAGISKVKLNKDSDRPDKKPIRFPNRKLLILKKCTPEVSVVKVKIDETSWTRIPSKSSRPKPIEYPSASFESSISKMMQAQTQPETKQDVRGSPSLPVPSSYQPIKESLSVGSDTAYCLTPDNTRHPSFSNPPGATYPSMMQPSMASFTSGFSALASNSSPDKPKDATSALPTANLPNPASILKSFSPQGTTTATTQGPAATNLSTAKPVNAFSASWQSPTLAGLLSSAPKSGGGDFAKPAASIVSGTPATGIFGTSGAAPGGLFSAGSTSLSFSFGSHQTIAPIISKETAPTDATAGTTKVTTAPPSFGVSSPSTPAASVTVSSSQPTTFGVPASKPATTLPTASVTPSGTGIFGAAPKTQIAPTSTTPSSTGLFGIGSVVSSSDLGGKPAPVSSSGLFSFSGATVSASSPLPSFGLSLTTSSDATTKSSAVTTSSGGLFSSAAPVSFSSGGTSIFGAPSNVVVSKPATTSAPVSVTTAATSIISSPVISTAAPTISTTTPAVTTAPTTQSLSAVTSSTAVTAATTSSSLPAFGQTSVSTASATPAVTTCTLFSAPKTTATSIFGSSGITFATATTAGTGLFGATLPATTTPTVTTTTATTSLFGSSPASSTAAPTGGLFSSPAGTTTTAGGLFSTSATTAAPTGLFSSTSLFSSQASTTTATTAAAPATGGFLSSLSISDSSNKTAASTAATTGGLFSASAFGTAGTTPSAASIFGGSGSTAFGSQPTTTAATFGTATGVFGQAKPATTSTGVFGSPTTGTAAPVFGGSATFGSPFGSSFGTTSASTTFGTSGGSIFGAAAATSTNPTTATGFGALGQQQGTTTSAFGGSAFSGGQQGSLFGATSPQRPAGGLFSSTFSSPTSTSAGSIFGGSGGGSLFGQSATTGTGAFSSGTVTGGVAQQGFGGFGQAKPAGSTFGSPTPAATAAPVFGGGATFGSTSPFGSSFSATSSTSAFGAGGSVFGGAAASSPTTGFGALAQQSSTSPGFGTGTGFGSPAAAQPQQQTSLFGSPTQQQSAPVFGGQAFSSWR